MRPRPGAALGGGGGLGATYEGCRGARQGPGGKAAACSAVCAGSAAPAPPPGRYIYTRLAPLTRFLFPRADDKLLAYLNEEGQNIEPEW